MKKSKFLLIPLIMLLGIAYAPAPVYALDEPHNPDDAVLLVNCAQCHYNPTPPLPSWLTTTNTGEDNTVANRLCKSCHFSGYLSETKYSNVQTHSSYKTSNKYGTWVIECRTCHQPHYQSQARAYSSLGSFVTGTVTSLVSGATSTVTVSNVLSANTYTNYLLVPNTAYSGLMYRIISNTTNTITVMGSINTTYAGAGKSYAIKYGKMMKNQVVTPRSGTRSVMFFRPTGTNSFADGDATIDGVCQVCHTKTHSFTNVGTLESTTSHPSNQAGKDCTTCHTHKGGFKADCASCHGYPPLYNTTVQGGLARYDNGSGTGSNNAGKHQKHAVTLGYACTTCHTGYSMPASLATKTVDIGFNIFSQSGGTYDGQTTVNYQGQNGTAVSKTGTRTCSNIYCHSNAKAGTSVVSYAAATWLDTAPALNCGSCHKGTSTGPDYANGGAGSVTANSHPRHVVSNSYGCQKCHNQTTTDGATINTASGKHVNGNFQDIYFEGLNSSGTYSTSKTCSATYCHGAGPSPAWGSTSLACDACHGANNLLQGGHSAHYETGAVAVSRAAATSHTQSQYVFNCGVCHYSISHAATPVSSNQAAEVDFDTTGISGGGTYTPGGSLAGTDRGFNWTAGTCSATYCHSQGQSSTYPFGGGPNVTPDWNGALDCKGCHSYTAASGTPVASSSHPKHVSSYPYNCARCHKATTTDGATITDKTRHVNNVKDVAWDGTNPGGGNYNTTKPQCTSLYCHSNGNIPSPVYYTPTWGTPSSGACGTCHGVTAASQPASARHAKHIASAAGAAYKYACSKCHSTIVSVTSDATTTPTILSTALHVNSVKNVLWDGTNSDGSAYTGGNCSNIYCHSLGTKSAATYSNPYTPVSWATTTLGTTCTGCHGGNSQTSTFIATGSHGRHVKSSDYSCTLCHNDTTKTDSRTISDFTKHVNKLVDIRFDTLSPSGKYATSTTPTYKTPGSPYQTCSSLYCHGTSVTTPLWGGSLAAGCASCHEASSALSSSQTNTNRHAAHYTTAATALSTTTGNASTAGDYLFNCGTCHYNQPHALGPADSAKGIAAGVTISVPWATGYTGGTYSAGTSTTADLKGFGYSYNNACSAVYCHSNGAPTGSPMTYQTVTWNQTAASPNCGICHGGYTGATIIATNKHPKHVNTPGYGYYCGECHYATTTTGTTITDRSKHVDFTKQVVWGSTSTGGSAYESAGVDTCSNIYCHSQGTASSSPYSSPKITAVWTSSMDATCTGCHGGNSQTATFMATGSHGKHVESSNHDCKLCHYATTAADSRTISTYANHVNKYVNIDFNSLNPSGTYGGFTTTAKTPDTAKLTCSSLYCHGASNTTPTWGINGTLNCASCHDASSTLPGRHSAHYGTTTNATDADRVASNGSTTTVYKYSCGVCHEQNLTSHATGTVSADQTAEVKFDTNIAGGLSNGGTYTPGAFGGTDADQFRWTQGTCGNIYCHSAGTTTSTPYTPPIVTNYTWSTASTLTCSGCHGFTGPTNTISTGKHSKHVNTPGYGYSCVRCHALTTNGATITTRSLHVNKVRDVDWDSMNPSGNDFAVTQPNCTNIYCHSKGTATLSAPNVTASWSGVATTCTSCHSGDSSQANIMSTGSHSQHVNNAAVLGTNYTCQRCHNATVTGNTTLSSYSKHVDATRDVSILTAGTWSVTAQTCSSTYCHGSNSGTWGANTSNATCTKCHGVPNTSVATYLTDSKTAAPGYLGTGVDTSGQTGTVTSNVSNDPEVGAHDTHLRALNSYATTTTVTCGMCHPVPVSANSTSHIDTATPADVVFSGLATSNGATAASYNYSTRTCTSTYCHGGAMPEGSTGGLDTSPTWTQQTYLNTGPNISGGDCDMCHASPPSTGSHSGGEAINDCNGCHPHVLTTGYFSDASKHINGFVEAQGDCVGCHTNAKDDGIGPARRALGSELTSTPWNHRYSGTWTKYDCGVCHMEGDPQTGATTTYHKTNSLEFRDPDTGTTIQGVNYSAASGTNNPGSYTPSGVTITAPFFSRNTGTSTLEPFAQAVMINLCLKCHDANGVSVTAARAFGAPDAKHPFSAQSGTVLNIKSHFTTTNASYHPILGQQNNGYCDTDTLEAPWGTGLIKSNGTTTQWGRRITCWDCHDSSSTSRTIGGTIAAVTSHGSNTTLRATYGWTLGTETQLCIVCHKTTVYYTGAAPGPVGLSAYDGSFATTNASHPATGLNRHAPNGTGFYGCRACHGSKWVGTSTPDPVARPTRAEDAHGFDKRADNTDWPIVGSATTQAKPFAFFRATEALGTGGWRPKSWPGQAAMGGGYCQGANMCGWGATATTYTPGGAY